MSFDRTEAMRRLDKDVVVQTPYGQTKSKTNYARAFAQRLIHDSRTNGWLESVREMLPSELRSVLMEFAGRLGEESTSHFESVVSERLDERNE